MRLIFLAAAAVALCMAAPAAAQQPDADSITMGAMEQMVANHGDVRDYTLVLSYGPVRVPAWVYRSGDEWQVQAPPEPPLAEMLGTAVIWPIMLSESAGKEEGDLEDLDLADAGYLGTETVGGRPAHVLFAHFGAGGSLPDSVRMYVDVETRQLLRVDAAGMPEEDGLAGAEDLRVSIDLADYAEHDGLTVPMRIRVRMQGDPGLSSKELQSTREDLATARAGLQELQGEEAEAARATLDLFEGLMLRGELDMQVTVEEVHVNTGPPAWTKETGRP
jgi:hypothetical protein